MQREDNEKIDTQVAPQGAPMGAHKKELVEKLFDEIAPRYDMLNHLLSLGIDKRWRRKVALVVAAHKPSKVLDVATGTGDLIVAIRASVECEVVGVDLSREMIERGRVKLLKRGIDAQMVQGDAENLEFDSDSFDALTCAFGVRNFGNLEAGLSEFHRVLKPGSICCILEYSRSERKSLYIRLFNLYFKHILPLVGGLISGSREAYQYLPDSVDGFCTEAEFVKKLEVIGFENCRAQSIMGGVVTLYTAYVGVKD